MYELPQTLSSTIIIPSSDVTADLISHVGNHQFIDPANPGQPVKTIDLLMSVACDILRDLAAAHTQIPIRLKWIYNQFTAYDASNIDWVNRVALDWSAMIMGLTVIYQFNGLYNPQGLTYWSYSGLQGYDLILKNTGG